jgi:hypothetical protein
VVAFAVAFGAAYGAPGSLFDAAPGPFALIARNSTVYEDPFVSPETVIGEVVPVAFCQVTPPSTEYW